MSDWKIKDAYVWLTSTDLRWVCDVGDGLTRELAVVVTEDYMNLDAYLLFEGNTLVRKCVERLYRHDRNIWLTDEKEIEAAYTLVMVEGVKRI